MSSHVLNPAPSPELRSALNDLRYEALVDNFDLLLSFATSARESAWRGSHESLGIHIRQTRLVLMAIIEVYKELDASGAEKSGRPA